MNARLLSLFAVLLFAVSCKTDPAPPKGPYQPPAVSEIRFKNTDNVIRIGLNNEPDNLSPLMTTAAKSRFVNELIFQQLNATHPETQEAVPLLASLPDVEQTSNGKVSYAYTIDDRATWPNGLPVTALDVVFSLKVMLNPLTGKGAYRTYMSMVENVVTTPNDERRLKVITDRPYILSQQAIGDLPIYPEYHYDPEHLLRSIRVSDLANDKKADQLSENNDKLIAFSQAFNDLAAERTPEALVGSGPYELDSWIANQEIKLVKRSDYWADDAQQPWLRAEADALIFKIIPDPNTMTNALRDELVDVAVSYPVEQFRNLSQDPFLRDRYNFVTVQGSTYFGVLLNQRNPLFRDAATRRALAHLVDVDALIEQLFPDGLATRAIGPVAPTKPYFATELQPIPYDPEAARQALAAAGWADSNGDGTLDRNIDGEQHELSFEFLIFPSPTSETIGTLISEWAAQAGVNVNVVVKDARSLYGELNKGNFAAAVIGQTYHPSIDDFTQSWASTSVPPEGSNRGGFADDEADGLIRRLRTELDAEKRAPMYARLQEIIYDNQPMIFLLSPESRLLISRRLDYTTRSKTPNLYFNSLEVMNLAQ